MRPRDRGKREEDVKRECLAKTTGHEDWGEGKPVSWRSLEQGSQDTRWTLQQVFAMLRERKASMCFVMLIGNSISQSSGVSFLSDTALPDCRALPAQAKWKITKAKVRNG